MEAESIVAVTHSVEETRVVAGALAVLAEPGSVITLDGDLGAGKTHFTQGFAQALGVTESVTSPTFNVLYVYDSGRIPLYHFDLYRLNDASELDDIAFFEYLELPGVSCIEWAAKFPEELPDNRIEVTITRVLEDETARIISARAVGIDEERMVRQWKAQVMS